MNKVKRFTANTAVLVFIFFKAFAYGDECLDEKAQFAKLNLPLIIEDAADARRLTPETEEAGTEQVHAYVEKEILRQLADDNPHGFEDVVAKIRCIQSAIPGYGRMSELTTAPAAFSIGSGRHAVALSYEIDRGGDAVPDLRPYFEVFKRIGVGWEKAGEEGSDFVASTFYVQPLEAPTEGEHWFLLYGNRIGDTGVRLRLEVVSYDGNKLRSVWKRFDIPWTYVDAIQGSHIVLKGRERNWLEFAERWDVVPGGLTLKTRRTWRPKPPPRP